MTKVGLEMSAASSPSPPATPFASCVLPAPSSPHSASTSPGRARRAMRSPIRSVCSDEWLTRSMVSALRGASTRRSALESAALTDEPDGKAEERAEERGPDQQPELARDCAQQVEWRADTAAERCAQGNETEDPDDRSPACEALLARVERQPLLLRIAIGPLLFRQIPL